MGVQVFIIQLMALGEEIKYHNKAPWSVMIRKERPPCHLKELSFYIFELLELLLVMEFNNRFVGDNRQ